MSTLVQVSVRSRMSGSSPVISVERSVSLFIMERQFRKVILILPCVVVTDWTSEFGLVGDRVLPLYGLFLPMQVVLLPTGLQSPEEHWLLFLFLKNHQYRWAFLGWCSFVSSAHVSLCWDCHCFWTFWFPSGGTGCSLAYCTACCSEIQNTPLDVDLDMFMNHIPLAYFWSVPYPYLCNICLCLFGLSATRKVLSSFNKGYRQAGPILLDWSSVFSQSWKVQQGLVFYSIILSTSTPSATPKLGTPHGLRTLGHEPVTFLGVCKLALGIFLAKKLALLPFIHQGTFGFHLCFQLEHWRHLAEFRVNHADAAHYV